MQPKLPCHLIAAGATLTASPALGLEQSLIVEQLGNFHFLILHFPVVLITLLPVVVILSLLPFGRFWRPTIPYFLHLGTASAIAATLFGFLALSLRQSVSEGLRLHSYGGYAVSGLMLVMSLLYFVKRPNLEKRVPLPLVIGALVAAGIVTFTAHFGGESVHGTLFILFEE